MKPGSLFDRMFQFLGQLILLNLLWILCSLPIITAGASTSALFYCTLKLHKDGDVRVVRDFFKSFKQNFKQSTLIWLMLAGAGLLLYLEGKSLAAAPGVFAHIFTYLLGAAGVILAVVALYIFPTVAAFENRIQVLLSSAFFFGIKHIGYLLAVAVMTILPMVMTLVDAKLFPVYLFLWLTVGFSLTAYGDSWFFWKLYRPYYKEQDHNPYTQSQETDRYAF